MRTQSRDTSPEAERVLIELIRKASVAKRFGLVRSMTTTLTKANIKNIQQLYPHAKWAEIVQILTSINSQSLTEALETHLHVKNDIALFEADILTTLASITEIFTSINISCYIGGSLATSIYGMQQLTQDIDLIVDLQAAQIPQLSVLLRADYYCNQQDIYRAVQEYTKFSIIHLSTLLKVEVIIPQPSLFESLVRGRVKWHILDENLHTFPLSSPEDIILVKLAHHSKAAVFPDDQWNDILGILKVQGPDLDLIYLDKWAAHLTITALLRQAYIDAGLRAAQGA